MINEIIFLASCILTAALTLGMLMFGANGLVAAITAQAILENLFVVKQIQLFGLHVTSADVFAVGLVFAFNLLQEFYGKRRAFQAIGLYFVVSVWFLLARTAQLWYLPSCFDATHQHFCQILASSPRIISSSIFTSVLSLVLDRHLYAWLRELVNQQSAWLANLFAIAASQLFDTVLFTFLALWGEVASPWSIIWFSFAIKLIAIALTAPFAAIARPLMRFKLAE